MSRSKEGRETNTTTSNEVDRTEATERDQKRSRAGYTAGRESAREFPRRPTSLTANQEDDRSRYGRGYNYQARTESRSRYNREQPYGVNEGFREEGGDPYQRARSSRSQYGTYGREAETDRGYYNRRDRGQDRDTGSADTYYTKSFNPRDGEYQRDRQPQLARHGGSFTRDYETSNPSRGRLQETDYDRDFEDRRSFERERYGRDYERDYDNQYQGRDYERDYGRQYEGRETPRHNTDDYYQAGRERQGTWYGRNQLRCRDVMTTDVTTCSPNTNLREVAAKLEDENVGSLPVVDNGRVVGIVTDRDIVCRVLAEGGDTRQATASGAMSEDIITCTSDEAVVEAIHKMGRNQIRRIPVIDHNGRLRGIISIADIALEAERDRELADALERISQPTQSRSRRIRH